MQTKDGEVTPSGDITIARRHCCFSASNALVLLQTTIPMFQPPFHNLLGKFEEAASLVKPKRASFPYFFYFNGMKYLIFRVP